MISYVKHLQTILDLQTQVNLHYGSNNNLDGIVFLLFLVMHQEPAAAEATEDAPAEEAPAQEEAAKTEETKEEATATEDKPSVEEAAATEDKPAATEEPAADGAVAAAEDGEKKEDDKKSKRKPKAVKVQKPPPEFRSVMTGWVQKKGKM